MRLDLRLFVERVTRIELALSAWEADVLPLNYTRGRRRDYLVAALARQAPRSAANPARAWARRCPALLGRSGGVARRDARGADDTAPRPHGEVGRGAVAQGARRGRAVGGVRGRRRCRRPSS